MRTTKSNQEGLTFHHNGTADGGELFIVVDPNKVDVEFDNLSGADYKHIIIKLEYNTIRDFVLQQLAKREISKLEQMDGDELARYYLS